MLITEFHKLYKKNGLKPNIIKLFQEIIYSYFKNNGREFPFRENITPYNVVVSEMMLQQTQTSRVSEKFLKFIKEFPDFQTLSTAQLENILKAWQGLGYNRRAIALKKIAEKIINEYNGKLPESIEILKTFPQIGHNTASSILTFAFNKPTIFLETNIRCVYFYFFFPNKRNIDDKQVLPLLEKTIDKENPRKWYYALMDYGVMLKKKFPDLNKQSAHYRKQTSFKGSNRELRGRILKILLKEKTITKTALLERLKISLKKLENILTQLEKEEFVTREDQRILISEL
ncbi:MAG: A/G-specific adenine glycosylase [Promethearchaeota archaeon]